MNKIVVSFSLIFCALFLHWTFGDAMPDENAFDLNDHGVEQELQNLARFQEAQKKSLPSKEEVQQPSVIQQEVVEKDSLSNDETPVKDLDGNIDLSNYKPKKLGKCKWCIWCGRCD